MNAFNKTQYGITFASKDGIKWFINEIRRSIMGCDCKEIFCPCEIFTDDEGNNGTLPVFQTKLAACADVCLPKQVIIGPQQCVKIDLLIGFDIPEDCKIVMYPRSSLMTKKGLIQPVSIIDADYSHMHVHAPIWNPGTTPVVLERGERVAQIECVPRYEQRQWERKDIEREGGFGSTGK